MRTANPANPNNIGARPNTWTTSLTIPAPSWVHGIVMFDDNIIDIIRVSGTTGKRTFASAKVVGTSPATYNYSESDHTITITTSQKSTITFIGHIQK